jgi:hypothetical protein
MKTLNASAAKVFLSLVEGLAPGRARKVDTTNGAFMPVSIDFLQQNADGSRMYAIAHRFEQNGDLCPDPDVEFYVVGDMIAPTAIDQVLGYRRSVEFDEQGKPARWNQSSQADLTRFCNMWMKNIRLQQGVGAKQAA